LYGNPLIPQDPEGTKGVDDGAAEMLEEDEGFEVMDAIELETDGTIALDAEGTTELDKGATEVLGVEDAGAEVFVEVLVLDEVLVDVLVEVFLVDEVLVEVLMLEETASHFPKPAWHWSPQYIEVDPQYPYLEIISMCSL
jgi:hypothetical protein